MVKLSVQNYCSIFLIIVSLCSLSKPVEGLSAVESTTMFITSTQQQL